MDGYDISTQTQHLRRHISALARQERILKMQIKKHPSRANHNKTLIEKKICKHSRFRRKISLIQNRFKNNLQQRISSMDIIVKYYTRTMRAMILQTPTESFERNDDISQKSTPMEVNSIRIEANPSRTANRFNENIGQNSTQRELESTLPKANTSRTAPRFNDDIGQNSTPMEVDSILPEANPSMTANRFNENIGQNSTQMELESTLLEADTSRTAHRFNENIGRNSTQMELESTLPEADTSETAHRFNENIGQNSTQMELESTLPEANTSETAHRFNGKALMTFLRCSGVCFLTSRRPQMGLTKKTTLNLLVLLLSVLCFEPHLHEGADVIGIGQTLSGNQTISSKANRNHPVFNPYDSQLKLFPNGNLALLNDSRIQIWSSNSTVKRYNSSVAILLDSGNFVIRDNQDSSDIIWQSFDYPTDTWLPGGKIGYNFNIKKEKIYLTSWRNAEDPAPGRYSLELNSGALGVQDYKLYGDMTSSSGAWRGLDYELFPDFISNFTYTSDANENVFTYEVAIPKRVTRFMIDTEGKVKQFVCRGDFPACHWDLLWDWPNTKCDVLYFCGTFETCNEGKVFPCDCLPGYERVWDGDYSSCIRKSRLECGVGGGSEDTFLSIIVQYPSSSSTKYSHFLYVKSDEECESACLRTCTCTGYYYVSDGKCVIMNDEVYNIKLPSVDMYGISYRVRIAKSGKASKTSVWIVVAASGGFIILLAAVILYILQQWKRKMGIYDGAAEDLMVFKYKYIRKSTKNFSEKLGEGGFGSVLKGTLPNSKAIAVKMLKNLKQGEKQFRAEVSKIGQIQHINLVRLQGFCIQGRRNMELLDDGDYFPALIADKISKGEEVLMQFLDHKLEGKADSNEVTRACKVACWCIQDDEKNRPTMGLVIQILEGISEVENPPFPQFLRGFTKYNQTESIVYQHFTSSATSSEG
uniref:Receptor-like serine/threonine-protein kinase n=1 Tax=Daucus carota subsp. sativus TaxID=79200 RepID=A0A162ADK4_DAUCS